MLIQFSFNSLFTTDLLHASKRLRFLKVFFSDSFKLLQMKRLSDWLRVHMNDSNWQAVLSRPSMPHQCISDAKSYELTHYSNMQRSTWTKSSNRHVE